MTQFHIKIPFHISLLLYFITICSKNVVIHHILYPYILYNVLIFIYIIRVTGGDSHINVVTRDITFLGI